MMTKDGELSPCPKCGCIPVVEEYGSCEDLDFPDRVMVYCRKCGNTGPSVYNGEMGLGNIDAVKRWNEQVMSQNDRSK